MSEDITDFEVDIKVRIVVVARERNGSEDDIRALFSCLMRSQ